MVELDLKIGCEFIETCPDTIRLRKSKKDGMEDEELRNQYDELCTTCGYETCLLYKMFLEEGSEKNGRT